MSSPCPSTRIPSPIFPHLTHMPSTLSLSPHPHSIPSLLLACPHQYPLSSLICPRPDSLANMTSPRRYALTHNVLTPIPSRHPLAPPKPSPICMYLADMPSTRFTRPHLPTSPVCPLPYPLTNMPSYIPSAHPYGHMPSPRFPHQYPLFSLTPIPSFICLRQNFLDHIPSPHPYVIAPITSPISPRPSCYVSSPIFSLVHIPSPRSLYLYPLTHVYPPLHNHMYDLASLPLCACSLHNIPTPHQYDLFHHDIHHHCMCHDHMYHHINTTCTTHQHQICK